MLKLLLLTTVACLILGGVVQETRGGLMPGIGHSKQYYLYHMYQKAVGRCYGDEVIRELDDQLRTFFGVCFATLGAASSDSKESATEKTNKDQADTEATTDEVKATTPPTVEKESSPFYSADITRSLKNDVFFWSKVVECLFDNYNITVSENGTVDGSGYIATFNEHPKISDELKSFLVPAMKDCERKSIFGDYLIWGNKFADFQKKLQFYRCADEQIYGACIKQDLKNSPQEFDLSGLDGDLSDVDDLTRRNFIASGYANWDRTGLWDHLF